MRLSIVILTHNRRDTLLANIARIKALADFDPDQAEIIVVDSGSTDGTADALSVGHADITLVRRQQNEGCGARNHGAILAKAPYILFCDDDSYPMDNTITQAIDYLDRTPQTAMLGGSIKMHGNTMDGAAYPLIIPACAMFVRASIYNHVGGFSTDFFRQAEEYDLAFRFLKLGANIERFEDLHFFHEKSPESRPSDLIRELDLRNNLVLCSRYFTGHFRRIFRQDWCDRYTRFAGFYGTEIDQLKIRAEVREIIDWDEETAEWRLSQKEMEAFFGMAYQKSAVHRFAHENRLQDILIAGMSKNIYVTQQAVLNNDLNLIGIADDHPVWDKQRYRGTWIRSLKDSVFMNPDGIVLAEINPARVDSAFQKLRQHYDGPILKLWTPSYLPPQ